MDYQEQISQCNNLEELFSVWRKKPPIQISYKDGEKEIRKTINHQEDFFIPDGIVNMDVWNSGSKKILFVLKEAYGKDWGDATLATWIRDKHPTLRIWKRIARLTYGIQNTTAQSIARYIPELSPEQHERCLDQISVLNIKKSSGESSSNYAEIAAYAECDKEEIKKELSLIDADIVICGATFKTLLYNVFEHEILNDETLCDNWYYYLNLDGKERLYIDAYHPANYWPDLMNYYTITSIYQQALISRKKIGGTL